MKFLLIQSPLLGPANYLHLTPPLGLLSIGAVLREESVDVAVLDLNLKAFQDPSFVEPATFYDTATALIASHTPDVVGFTSMALESHVCLELARRLKQLDPQVVTLFGGPHFSSIAVEAMRLYPWMDYVATGAAESSLVALTHHLRNSRTGVELSNIAYRNSAGVTLDRRPVKRVSLDDLPRPAHDLIDVEDYFALNPRRMLCIEHARGCQLRCAFCYSEAHWGHGESTKSIERTIDELRDLAGIGASHVFFVADNFVTNRAWTEQICAAITDASLGITWQCYATLAQLDESAVDSLATAGCTGVFVGVDAVSPITKRDFRKTYFKGWDSLRERIEMCISRGVKPTCSFMLSLDDDVAGIESTLTMAVRTRNLGAQLCLNALAVYNGTSIDLADGLKSMRYSEEKPDLLYGTYAVNSTNEYAKVTPELFPMHQSLLNGPESEFGIFQFCQTARDLIELAPGAMLAYETHADEPLSVLIYRVMQQRALEKKESPRLVAHDRWMGTLRAFSSSIAAAPWATESFNHDMLSWLARGELLAEKNCVP